jgi:hypothetical protein
VKRSIMLICAVFAMNFLIAWAFCFAEGSSVNPVPLKVQCSAQGTSTQSGALGTITIEINEYSSDQEREALILAFDKSGTPGLTAALKKQSKKGLISIAGQPDVYEVKFVRLMPDSTQGARNIRLVTDRPIGVGEAMVGLPKTTDYSLLALEMKLDMSKMGKSTGILLPAIELVTEKNKKTEKSEVSIKARKNPWKLFNFFNYKELK